MPRSTKSWTVAFVGDGDITEDNAKELLDTQLFPVDAQVAALIPPLPRRGYKGLKTVAELLDKEFDIPTREMPAVEFTAALQEARQAGEEVALVILGTDDPAAVEAAEAALETSISVKDLCAALDDVEFEPEPVPEPEPEPAAPRRSRGRPRKDATVQATPAGPANVIVSPLMPPINPELPVGELTVAELIEAAIRLIAREELAAMFPGVHASGPTDEPAPPEEKTVRAFVNSDGAYRRATKRSRAREAEGETEVMLTETEARDAGLTG
jgi:hypothetical protein